MNRLKIIKIAALIAIFATMVFLDSRTAFSQNENGSLQFEKKLKELPADSPFLDNRPRIDSEAAATEKTDDVGRQNYLALNLISKCRSLPQSIWVLLVGAYLFLLIMNLIWNFEKSRELHWFWETLYTLLALLAWNSFDDCRSNTWFPAVILETGLIIYAFYLYFASRRIPQIPTDINENNAGDNTAKLPFE